MKNTDLPETQAKTGVIVIGRNEGLNIKYCLSALEQFNDIEIIYVDSGSTDGSLEYVTSIGIPVHKLDPVRPFSAARARREGVNILLDKCPEIEYIQFVDGDCEMSINWIDTAKSFLNNNKSVSIVCGVLREKEPESSIYNWLSSFQWNMPLGEINACGGLFMIRVNSYVEAGGFNEKLITREEKDLCDRIRAKGDKIVRICEEMALHDSGLLYFNQWWKRAIWGGYGDALHISTNRKDLNIEHLNRIRRYLTWPFALPLIALFGIIGMIWYPALLILPLFILILYNLLFLKITIGRIRIGESLKSAILYSFFRILRKFATGYGFLKYFVQYEHHSKRPDPHTI